MKSRAHRGYPPDCPGLTLPTAHRVEAQLSPQGSYPPPRAWTDGLPDSGSNTWKLEIGKSTPENFGKE
jgi:hypothetical protein